MQTPKSCQVSPSLLHPPSLQPSTFYPQVLRGGDQPAWVELLDGHRVRHRPLSCQVAPATGLEVALQDPEEGTLKDVRLPRLGHGLPAQQVTSCLWEEKLDGQGYPFFFVNHHDYPVFPLSESLYTAT